MPMPSGSPWYRTGTVNVTNGSINLVFTDTLLSLNAAQGDIFKGPDGKDYEIDTVTDDTHAALKTAYLGATAAAQSYAIVRNFANVNLPASLAAGLSGLLTKFHSYLDQMLSWLTGSGTVSLTDAVGNTYNVQTPTALQAALHGRLVKSVAGSTATINLTSAEAANRLIELTGARTAALSLTIPDGTTGDFHVYNNTSGAYTITVKTASGTGVVVPQGGRVLLECDATNVVNPLANIPGSQTVNGNQAVTPPGNAVSLSVIQGTDANAVRLSAGGNTSAYMEVRGYLGVKLLADTTVVATAVAGATTFVGTLSSTGQMAPQNGINTTITGTSVQYKTNATDTVAAPAHQFSTIDGGVIVAKFSGLNTGNDQRLLVQGRGGECSVVGQAGRVSLGGVNTGYLGTIEADGSTFNKAISWDSGGNVAINNLMGRNGFVAYSGIADTINSHSGFGAGTLHSLYTGWYGASTSSAGTLCYNVTTNGNVTNTNNSYGAISDQKLKQDIIDAKSQWDDLMALRVRKYRLKIDPTGPLMMGLIAQEAELVSPGLIETTDDYEDVVVEPARTEVKIVQRPKTQKVSIEQRTPTLVNGRYVLRMVPTELDVPLFEEHLLFDETGSPIMEQVESEQPEQRDEDGKVIAPAKPAVQRQAVHRVPVMEDVEETVEIPAKTERRPTGTQTKSIKYSILYMKAVKTLQEAMVRIEVLEAEVVALKTQ